MMKKNIKGYHKNFLKLINAIKITGNKRKALNFYDGILIACKIIERQAKAGGKIFFIGNGGSAAIASHMAIDFWKNLGIPAMSFNDNSLLTCISNDFGYENVFAKPIEFFAGKNDILFAISSSGNSRNILKGAEAMLAKKGRVITLSGFKENNPLSSKGICNFYVPAHEYGSVEVIHQYICHFIFDTIMEHKSKREIR